MQKCVLMITIAYHPSNASGMHRSVANAKYLPLFGWTPVVVCKRYSPDERGGTYDPQLAALPDICKVVRVGDIKNRVIKKAEIMFWKIFGGGKYDYRYPYMLCQRMKRASEQIVKKQQIDAIWATSLLGLDHKIADYLSRKYAIPWVADFRDLPDQSYMNRNIRHVVKQEVKTCSTAKALTTVTEALAEKLRTRHKAPVYTIFNGFDPDEFKTSPKPGDYGDKFTLNYFGILHEYRNPSPLFAAIDRLIQQNKIDLNDVRINFYGANSKMVSGFARGYCCASQVKTLNRLPYPEMVKCQKASQILLTVTSPQSTAIPAKLYGYLASDRPILNIPCDGAGTDYILRQTKAGVSLSKPEEIAVWLEQAYKNWKQTGIVEFSGRDESEIQKYSRKTQAGQLAEILDKVSNSQ